MGSTYNIGQEMGMWREIYYLSRNVYLENQIEINTNIAKIKENGMNNIYVFSSAIYFFEFGVLAYSV